MSPRRSWSKTPVKPFQRSSSC